MLTVPDWRLPPGVHCAFSSRQGGCSRGAHAQLNLGAYCDDDEQAVRSNRELFARALAPARPCWLRQVHGSGVVRLSGSSPAGESEGDIAITDRAGLACTVLTADCVPILLAAGDGSQVAAVHAGWRGLAAGIVEVAAALFSGPFLAWLGPHICAGCYRVGDDVKRQLVQAAADERFFSPAGGGWLADLGGLAGHRLAGLERCESVADAGICNCCDSGYFSVRRDGAATGRSASAIWKSED